MKYDFIQAHRKTHCVKRLCRMLGIARSTYYAQGKRKAGVRERENRKLEEQIRAEFVASRQTYGALRIWARLVGKGVACGRHRVARLMHKAGLRPRLQHRFRPMTTQRQPGIVPAPNRLNREFSANVINQKWVSDFTYIDTAEGWLYLSIVLDVFSRKIVGWCMADQMTAALVEKALCMALQTRQPSGNLLHHSDQGSQYTSASYQKLLSDANIQASMSRVGNCYDNALAESFFGTLKTECVTEQFPTRDIAHTTIFEYIEVWYNRQRLHSSLGYLSPEDFEKQSDKICVY